MKKVFQMLPRDEGEDWELALELVRWRLLTLERRMVSYKSRPKTVVGVGSREKERSGSRDSNYRPPLRKFCCRGKQRSEEAAREEQVSRFILFISFFLFFLN